jgi:hypothetical protein
MIEKDVFLTVDFEDSCGTPEEAGCQFEAINL